MLCSKTEAEDGKDEFLKIKYSITCLGVVIFALQKTLFFYQTNKYYLIVVVLLAHTVRVGLAY